MAVQVINGGIFTKEPGDRPGLYVRIIERAIAAIAVGSRSKVATVALSIGTGTAVAGKVYRVGSIPYAQELFGADGTKDIETIFRGGASEVVVAVTDGTGLAPTWVETLQSIETYDFHIFVLPKDAPEGLDTAAFTWLTECKKNGMNFVSVFAEKTAEGNVTSIKAAATAVKDESVVFVSGGVITPKGVEVPADEYALYIAGVIAGTALDGSITYKEVPYTETISRFRTTEIKELLAAGVLVTSTDGDIVKIEQGLTLGKGQFSKIRTVRAKQAMIDDINKAVNDNYIGKITNSPDGQIAVINAIKTYLEVLANGNVIDINFSVEIDKTVPSVGSEMYVNVSVRFLDSIEYVYMTITV